jgi:hypothetical protein
MLRRKPFVVPDNPMLPSANLKCNDGGTTGSTWCLQKGRDIPTLRRSQFNAIEFYPSGFAQPSADGLRTHSRFVPSPILRRLIDSPNRVYRSSTLTAPLDDT